MTHSPVCHRVLLASGPLARLEFCSHCQAVSLHLGALTLRLERAALESLHSTLREALGALREGRAGAPPGARAGLTRGAA